MLTWASDGDGRKQARAVQFDGKLELGSFGATITSDAWRRPSRKRDEAFRWTEMSSTLLSDPRRGKETQHACNACFECACYHPLLLFNRHGDQKRPGVSKTAGGAVHEGYSRGFRPRCCSSACRAASPMGSTRGKTGRCRLNRAARLRTMPARGLTHGKCRLKQTNRPVLRMLDQV